MDRVVRFSIALLALAWAGCAAAQDADPMGRLLDQAPEMDEETAETLGEPPAAAQPAPLTAPALPNPTVPPPLSTPVTTPPVVPAPTYSPPPPPPVAAPVYAPPPPAIPAPQPTASGATPYPYAPPASTPPPAYVPPPRPQLSSPVMVDQLDRTPEAPLNPTELGYESRLRNSFASAQGLQGPLDGAWTLRGRDGQALYALLLVDKGVGQLEGAWRDPRRRGAIDASGFLSDIQRVGAQLNASFYPHPGAGAVSMTLNPGSDGSWTGELDENGRRTGVTLKRD